MVSNRRNYYRLLQVQPDAAPEVIKAAYRALMGLHHPDKGGDHATAVLINEAFAVLSDVAKRQAYDAQRAARAGKASLRDQAPRAAPKPAPATDVSSAPRCPMCDSVVRQAVRPDARCPRCTAPLMVIARQGMVAKPNERRGIPRVTKSDWGVLHLDWQAAPIDVRMRDLSLDGISLYSGLPAATGQRVRVCNDAFDVVADIVSCRRLNNVFTLHARLVTAIFTARGGFVSRMA